jgi:hypothetical protein
MQGAPKRGTSTVAHAKESKSNSIFMTAKKNLLPGGTGAPCSLGFHAIAGASALSVTYV